MKQMLNSLLFCLLVLCLAACGKHDAADTGMSNSNGTSSPSAAHPELVAAMKRVEPFFRPMGEPEQFDWLESHTEPGQTFEQYLGSGPTRPTAERKTIYVLPLGRFNRQQQKVIDIASGYLAEFFDLPVVQMPAQQIKRPLRIRDVRRLPHARAEQVRTGFIIDELLRPQLPADAAALIAFTDEDLFPDPTMNYVFGQASLDGRVGVWSLYRLDDNADAATFLRRTLKIAAHETGHMFSMWHCTKYECVMSGTNHLGETDKRPVDACPECMAKICWLSDIGPAERYERLAAFCRRARLAPEADEFTRKAAAVRSH